MRCRAAEGSGMPKRYALRGKRMTALQRQTNGDRDRLSATIHFLGDLLGNVIREQAGVAAFELEEQVRGLAKDLRAIEIAHPEARARITALQAELQRLVASLPSDQMRDLIRSFSTYFALVNLSEQLQRIWVLRDRAQRHPNEPRTESIMAAVSELKQAGVAAPALQEWLDSALILPVFTAHPTEARRRTTLEKLRRIADIVERDSTGLALPADGAAQQAIIEEIVGLWQSDEVRIVRPTVL